MSSKTFFHFFFTYKIALSFMQSKWKYYSKIWIKMFPKFYKQRCYDVSLIFFIPGTMNVTHVEKAKMVCLKCLRVTIETPSCCSAISTEQCSSIKLYSNRMDFIVVFYLIIVCYTSILEFQSEDSIHIYIYQYHSLFRHVNCFVLHAWTWVKYNIVDSWLI